MSTSFEVSPGVQILLFWGMETHWVSQWAAAPKKTKNTHEHPWAMSIHELIWTLIFTWTPLMQLTSCILNNGFHVFWFIILCCWFCICWFQMFLFVLFFILCWLDTPKTIHCHCCKTCFYYILFFFNVIFCFHPVLFCATQAISYWKFSFGLPPFSKMMFQTIFSINIAKYILRSGCASCFKIDPAYPQLNKR